MKQPRKPTAVLISGSGTTLQSLIDASQADDFPAEIMLVISNKPGVPGLERATKAGIDTLVIPHQEYETRDAFDAAIHESLEARNIELVCLAGFMRILTTGFTEKWLGKMLNIHPALLPSFKGHRAHEQVLASDVTISGSTVHAVIPELDAGPIVAQGAVPRLPEDDLNSLSARVRGVEQQLYPLAVRTFLGQRPSLPVTDGMILSNNPQILFGSDVASGRT
ncbi:MAG: phosphoribosylglycinamide formyltransferase [Pseudomonadota bacterium]